MVTGSNLYQGMFQNILYELADGGDGRQYIMPVTKLSGDAITKDGGASIEILGNGIVSTNNSSGNNLAANGVFSGTADNVVEYTHIIVTIHTDVASATDGLSLQFLISGIWHETDAYTIPANSVKTYSIQPVSEQFRLVYTNGVLPQTMMHLEVQYRKSGGVISSHRIKDDVTPEDDAQLVQTVIKARRPNNYFANVDASINGQLSVGIGDIQADAGARVRVSQLTTLGDYKMIGYNHDLLMEEYGDGSGTYSNNKYLMSVAADQYKGLNSLRPHQYFSGKSQLVEPTFDNFAPQTGTVKRIGYYSNQPTGTYDSLTDGIRLESNGNSGTIYLQTYRTGVETHNIPMEQWSGYEFMNSYQNPAIWDNFTVCFIDFLWLGGAIIRLWVKTAYGFVLAHVFNYSGTDTDTFILSPNHPIRYELRSLGGTGSFRYICSQVATEGSVNESGITRSFDTGLTPIALASAGVTYPIKAVRKQSNLKNNCARLEDIAVFVSSSDNVFWSIQINPTLSAPLTYTDAPSSCLQHATGDGTITVTSPGTIIASGYLTQNTPIPNQAMIDNFLAWLGGTIDGTQQEYVVCIGCLTNNIAASATMITKEY